MTDIGTSLVAGVGTDISATGGLTIPHPTVFLGANLRDVWDSRDATLSDIGTGNEGVDSWTGRKLGLVVVASAATTRPTLTAANAAFNNKPTVNTASAGTRRLRSAGDEPTIFAAATRPYLALYGSYAVAGSAHLFCFDDSAGASPWSICNVAAQHTFIQNNSFYGTYAASDANPHLYEGWSVGADAFFAVDGVTVATFTGAAMTPTVTRVGIGCNAVGSFGVSSSSLALLVACIAPPSAGERATLLAYCQQEY